MDGERVEPWLLHGVRRVQRWRRGNISHWACAHVTLGVLADNRWFVEYSGKGAHAWGSESAARAAAARLIRDGDWVETPAEFGPDGQPTSPGWVRRGGTWHRDSG